jgi:hypothetical protein
LNGLGLRADLPRSRDDALASFREALTVAHRLGIEWLLGDILLDAIATLGPDDPESATYATEGGAIFTRAGASTHLERLDELMRPATGDAAPSGRRGADRTASAIAEPAYGLARAFDGSSSTAAVDDADPGRGPNSAPA